MPFVNISSRQYLFRNINCNICNIDKTVFLGERNPLAFNLSKKLISKIVKCKNCDLIYANPMPFPTKEQFNHNYGNADEYFPNAISHARLFGYNHLLKNISTYVPSGKLLDVGCGRGELLYVAQKQGWQVKGVELSENFAHFAKQRFGLNIEVGNIKNLNFKDEEFDVICLISVLQHTYDPQEILHELHRILKKKGLLFIETMNQDSWVYKFSDLYLNFGSQKRTSHLSPTFPSYQVYGFSPKSISKILKLTGFKIIKQHITGGVNSPEKKSQTQILIKFLKLIRKIIIRLSIMINKGQVLMVYAQKEYH